MQPKHSLWRWYRDCDLFTQIVLGVLALVVVLCLCTLCMAAAPSFVQGFERGINGGYVTPAP